MPLHLRQKSAMRCPELTYQRPCQQRSCIIVPVPDLVWYYQEIDAPDVFTDQPHILVHLYSSRDAHILVHLYSSDAACSTTTRL